MTYCESIIIKTTGSIYVFPQPQEIAGRHFVGVLSELCFFVANHRQSFKASSVSYHLSM